MDQTPGNQPQDRAVARTAGNPFFSSALNGGLLPASSVPQAGQTVELVLGSHNLPLRSSTDGRLLIHTYDTGTTPITDRSMWHTDCTLSFQVGDGPTVGCPLSSVHFLDDMLLFKAGGGQIADSILAEGEYYFLAVQPDIIVSVERRLAAAPDGSTIPSGFRFVIANPIGNDPLVISVTAIDQTAGAAIVEAGVAFMRNQVGSQAGWRPIDDGWETMEWNGQPASSMRTIPTAASAAASAAVAAPPSEEIPPQSPASMQIPPAAAAAAAAPSLGAAAAATAPPIEEFEEPDSPSGRDRLAILAVLGTAVLLLIGWLVVNALSDSDDADLAAASEEAEAIEPTTTSAAPTTTTTVATTTTTEATTTTTIPPPTVPVPSGEQLATWGFLERTELAAPSGDAVCPAGDTATVEGTIVGVGGALNIRDGADSSFEIVQRIALGYDTVTVFPSLTERSDRGTEWVKLALPVPPGWYDADADPDAAYPYGCGWAATQYLDYDQG